ncbi:hypothetical protein [Nonomuraea sp. NPDC050310]|uniref:hypothetical protein n=1 Tax=Nonomuraea sp. NPDC050310 TaxID=3154935 RepID=UPI0034075AB5
MTTTTKTRALLTAAAATLTAGALLLSAAGASTGEYGKASGVQLYLPPVDLLGQPAYSGIWGTVAVENTPGTDTAVHPTWPDPDGMSRFMSLANGTLYASGVDAPDAWEGRADLVVNRFALSPSATVPLLSTGNVNNYARCTEQAKGFAAVQSAPGTIRILGDAPAGGTAIENGQTVSGTVTGAQLGFPNIDSAKITARRTDHETPPGALPAEAWIEITFTGVIKDEGGRKYSGPLASVVLARTCAFCKPKPKPTPTTPTPTYTTPGPTPTTPGPTPTTPTPTYTTPGPTPTTPGPTPTTPGPTPTTPGPTPTTPTATTPTSDRPRPHRPHDHGGGGRGPGSDDLPMTGLPLVYPALAVAAIGAGLAIRYASRRRRTE